MTVLSSEEVAELKAGNDKATHTTIIRDKVTACHRLAHKVDVKQIYEKAWRVNVYESDGSIVPRITLPYSYYVKLGDDGSLRFDPPLGRFVPDDEVEMEIDHQAEMALWRLCMRLEDISRRRLSNGGVSTVSQRHDQKHQAVSPPPASTIETPTRAD